MFMSALEGDILPCAEGCHLDLYHEFLVKGQSRIALSRIQFRLLYYLARNPERLVTKNELITFAWGNETKLSQKELHVYINRLRRKLGDNSRSQRYILTVYKAGYILNVKG